MSRIVSTVSADGEVDIEALKQIVASSLPNEVVMDIIDALDDLTKRDFAATAMVRAELADVYRNCSSHVLHLLCRRLVVALTGARLSSDSNFRDHCALQLLVLLSSTQFSLGLKLTWKDLISILEEILPLSGAWHQSIPISRLVQFLLNDLGKFLERITNEALNGDAELARHFAFNPECGSRLFAILISFLKKYPHAPNDVILSSFTTLRNLLPYFYPKEEHASFEEMVSFLIRTLQSSNEVNEQQHAEEESKSETQLAQITSQPNDSEKQRKFIVKEIIATEETYVTALEQIRADFIQPLRDRKILSKAQLSALFSNIEAILDFHKVFFSHLQQSPESIASIFLKLADFLKMYTLYVNSYSSCIEAMCDLKDHAKFQAFMRVKGGPEGSESAESQLMSALITPIQRIPRYLLLLKEMLRHTPADHPETEQLQRAVEKIAAIAEHVNQSKKRAEDFTKVIGIQGKINAGIGIGMASMLSRRKRISLAGPQRRLIRDGIVMKPSKSAFKKVGMNRFYLFNDLLLWTTCSYKFKGITPLVNAKVRVAQTNQYYGLEVVVESSGAPKTIVMLFDVETNRDAWKQDLENAIDVLSKGRVILKSPGMHLEKDVSSILPQNDELNSSFESTSNSLALSPKGGVSSIKNWNFEEELRSLSEKENLFSETVKLIVMILLIYHEELSVDSINRIDRELLENMVKSAGSFSPVLANVLDYWIVRFEVLDFDLPMRSDHRAFKDHLTSRLLTLLPNSLSLALSADALQTTSVINKDGDQLSGLPLPTECWGYKVVACLTSASRSFDISSELESFIKASSSSTDWKVRASTAFATGIFSHYFEDEKCISWIVNTLSDHRNEDRRVLDAIVWALCKAGESKSPSRKYLAKESSFISVFRNFVQITNRLVASIESDAQLLENICKSTVLMIKAREAFKDTQKELKEDTDVMETLAESLSLNILLQAKSVVNYDLRSTSQWLFECLSVIYLSFPASCSKPVVHRVAFPKLIELLEYQDNSGPEVALGALMDGASSEVISQFSDQIASKAKTYNRHSLIPKLTALLSQSVSFVSFIENHAVEKYIVEIMEGQNSSRSTLLMVMELASKVVKDCSQRQSDSSLSIMRNICSSVTFLLSRVDEEDLIQAVCGAQCRNILVVGAVLNNTWSKFINVLEAKAQKAELMTNRVLARSRIQTYDALKLSNCVQVFAINAASIIQQVCTCMEILLDDSPQYLCAGLNIVGFIVHILKHRVFESLYPVIPFMSRAIETSQQPFDHKFSPRESGCALFAQIARACEPESSSSVNWESRKYLATLLGQCQDGLIDCLSCT
jgi:hypothetical protein